jgi:endonuclease/exonuclease/phosphatase family metal-dependent hydrolase
MKNNNWIILLLLIIFIFGTSSGCGLKQEKNLRPELTIMSYNVRNCVGMDGVTDYQRVADIILKADADVVALQELDSATQRSGGVVVLDELARLTGMFGVYGPAIDFQGGKYGVGMLLKERPLSWETHPLPGREETRAILAVELDNCVVCCTHFSLTPEDRLESVRIIEELVKGYEKPVLLAGDINDLPDSAVLKGLGLTWNILSDPQKFTHRSDKPEKCIDYIFGLANEKYEFKVIDRVVGEEPVASDHLPLWVKVEILQ